MKKLTFKNYVPTGRYASFETEQCDIKRNKNIVGSIAEANHFSKVSFEERFSISLMIIDETQECGWKWITLKKKFSNMNNAREFVKANDEQLQKQFNLRESK